MADEHLIVSAMHTIMYFNRFLVRPGKQCYVKLLYIKPSINMEC